MNRKNKPSPSGQPPGGKPSGQIQQVLVRGLGLHQKGQYKEAQACYEQVLKQQPRHLDALHLSGVLAYEMQDYQRALLLLGQAIEINPANADAYYNLGLVLQAMREFQLSLECYDKAIALKAGNAEAYSNRGLILHELKQYEAALQSYEQAITLKPDYAEAYYNLGIVLQDMKTFQLALECYDKAIAFKADFAAAYNNRGLVLQELAEVDHALASYDRAIALNPAYAAAWNNRGLVLKGLAQSDAAIQSYDQAILLNPAYAEAYSNRGDVLFGVKRFDAALHDYGAVMALRPDDHDAHYNHGRVLQELKEFDRALASYDRAIALKPDYVAAWDNRGIVLKELKQYAAAIESYDQAIALNADNAEAYSNRGNVLQALKQLDAAMQSYDCAIALKSDYAQAYLNRSMLDLLQGNFGRGWQEYEQRWEEKESGIFIKREFSQPQWEGEKSLEGKTILLHAEQGLGDTLQFSRYASLVAERGAKVILEVQPPLAALLQGLEGVNQLIAQGDPLPDFDCHCPLLSLPLAFKSDINTIPRSQAYLKSDANKVAAWTARLGAKSKPRIGIVWSGNSLYKNDHNRSVALTEFIHLLSDDYQFICLQKEIREEDQIILRSHPEIIVVNEALNDFTDTAALCDLMDAVISVDTSVLHLAGALGKQTWALLPYVPDWRWLLDREDSPWYPSMRLYRQAEAGNWLEVLEQVKADLRQAVKMAAS